MLAGKTGQGLRVPRWLLIGCMALLVALIGYLWRASDQRLAEQARYNILVDERITPVASANLRDCLGEAGGEGLGLSLQGQWGKLRADPRTWRVLGPARRTMVDVTELGSHRRVRVYAYDGRALPASERAALDRCTGR